jgi:hypothetical protein
MDINRDGGRRDDWVYPAGGPRFLFPSNKKYVTMNVNEVQGGI